jgi:hypothetical protein
VGAHEQGRTRRAAAGNEAIERASVKSYVPTSTVTAGAAAADETDLFEHVQMVGEKVRRDADEALQFDGRPIRARQFLNDPESGRVAQCGMSTGTHIERVHEPRRYDSTDNESTYLE